MNVKSSEPGSENCKFFVLYCNVLKFTHHTDIGRAIYQTVKVSACEGKDVHLRYRRIPKNEEIYSDIYSL